MSAGRPTEPLGWDVQAVYALALARAGRFAEATRENDLLLTKVATNLKKGRLPNLPLFFMGAQRSQKSLQQQLTLHKAFILRLEGKIVESTDAATEAGHPQPESSLPADHAAVQQVLKAIAELPMPTAIAPGEK